MPVFNPSRSQDNTHRLQRFIDRHDVIEFAAGSTTLVNEQVFVRDGKRITTEGGQPALIRKGNVTPQLFCVNGRDVSFEGLAFDWNFRGEWYKYASCIDLAVPDYLKERIKPRPIGNIQIAGCSFINQSPWGTHKTGDAWCISMTPGDTFQDIDRVFIEGCVSRGPVQLTGNGSVRGRWLDVRICCNQVIGARASAIALTSQASGEGKTWINATIADNVILAARNFGILIGQDTSRDDVRCTTHAEITRNYIEMASTRGVEFPQCIMSRAGKEEGDTHLRVHHNVFDVQQTSRTNKPRFIVMKAWRAGSTLEFFNNETRGDGSTDLRNVTITRREGNREVE